MDLNINPGLMEARPPRREDAGLEDTALPATAIQEAFKRASDAVQSAQRHVHSTASGILGKVGTGDKTESHENAMLSNGLEARFRVDPKGTAALGEEQSCVGNKGGTIEKGRDLIPGELAGTVDGDRVVVGTDSGPKLGDAGCVEGLAGDTGGRKADEEENEGPILILARD